MPVILSKDSLAQLVELLRSDGRRVIANVVASQDEQFEAIKHLEYIEV